MDALSKHQLILVALLVSFVTSLATGIVTVSLMDQAPDSVTRTITQVIQKTVADAAGATSTAAISIAVSDQVADATAAVVPSIVHLREGAAGRIAGLGLVVSSAGVIIADKTMIDNLNEPQAIYADGEAIPVSIVRFQVQGDIAFLMPMRPITQAARPVSFGEAPRLGASVWSLYGSTTYALSQGIVSQIDATNPIPDIQTSISSANIIPGAPLFDALGSVVGIATRSYAGPNGTSFYPVQGLKGVIPR